MSLEQKKLIAEKRAQYDARAKKKAAPAEPAPSRRKPGSSVATNAASDATPLTDDLAGAGAESAVADDDTLTITSEGSFPATASMCGKCNTKAVIIMDGCATCLNCGYSKCG
jgi:hypothetical protein